MKDPWLTLYGQILIPRKRILQFHLGKPPILPSFLPELSCDSIRMVHSGAGYTFGSGVVHKFLETNGMTHILRAHQLCMEGYASLFDNHLSTVWSAPNYCYRCGNSASILEVSPGGKMYFNVFEAAPENERDGPSQQAAQNAGGKVSVALPRPYL
jgi:serine/threonine-protein phosphatase PPG1